MGTSLKLPVKNPLMTKKGTRETKKVLKKEPIHLGLLKANINNDRAVKVKHTRVYILSE
jgi:hypothetical protein